MIKLLYCIYQILVFPLFLLATIITSLVTCIGCVLGNSDYWGYWPGKIWSIFTCRLLLLPVKVEHNSRPSPNKSYIFVANHQGTLDIFLIYGFLGRNFKWIMKQELRHVPFIGVACEKAHHLFIGRNSPASIAHTLDQARKTLQNGMSLVVFPEGSRTFNGKVRPFHNGAFQLAAELQLPIVPITINGSFAALPRTRKAFINWHPLRLTLHEPIVPTGTSREELKALSQQARNIIDADVKRD